MILGKKELHTVSLQYWGWMARPFAVDGEAFVLTSPFIERDYRQLGILQIPHDDKPTSLGNEQGVGVECKS